MKILLVNKFHYRKGGSETYYWSLAELLESMGHEVVFFAMQDEKNEPCEQEKYFVSNVSYVGKQSAITQAKSAVKLLYSFEAKHKFEQLILAEKPDVIHMNLVHRQITLSIVDVAAKYHIPVVFTQHDLICVCPNYTCMSSMGICEACINGNFINCFENKCVKGSRAKSLMGSLEAYLYKLRGTYNKIDYYITPSLFYKELLTKANFTRSPIVHIPNFLPLEIEYKKYRAENAHLLFMGRLSEEKGLVTLLHAIAMCPDIYLDVAGDGPIGDVLKHMVDELGISERVHFYGFITGAQLAKVRSECKALVLPSEWYENGPYSIMEALACGKPVIGSNIAGIPEMLQDGESGFTFKMGDAHSLADAIIKLNSLSTDDYERMCDNAVAFARNKFSAQEYGKKILSIYQKLIDEKTKFNRRT